MLQRIWHPTIGFSYTHKTCQGFGNLSPAAMENVVESFNEYFLAHAHIPHMFSIPCLMIHLWRKQLYKDADVFFTINVGPSFWPCSIHEPLIVLIFLPLDHVSSYRGPWVLRGSSTAFEVKYHLEDGFKTPELHGCGKFHDLEGPMHGVRYPKEEWIWSLLFKFLEDQKTFPPPCYAVCCR